MNTTWNGMVLGSSEDTFGEGPVYGWPDYVDDAWTFAAFLDEADRPPVEVLAAFAETIHPDTKRWLLERYAGEMLDACLETHRNGRAYAEDEYAEEWS